MLPSLNYAWSYRKPRIQSLYYSSVGARRGLLQRRGGKESEAVVSPRRCSHIGGGQMLTARYLVRAICVYFSYFFFKSLFYCLWSFIDTFISLKAISLSLCVCCSREILQSYFKVKRITALLISRHVGNCSHDTDRAFLTFSLPNNCSLSHIWVTNEVWIPLGCAHTSGFWYSVYTPQSNRYNCGVC